jgi:hypothetical protein
MADWFAEYTIGSYRSSFTRELFRVHHPTVGLRIHLPFLILR